MSALKSIALKARFVFCVLAAFFNGIDLGLQGNGNFILSGFLIGIVVGLVWSTVLLFVPSRLTHGLRPAAKATVEGVCVVAALVLIVIVCLQIWGHRNC
jgi:hypothetical protein